MIVRPRFSNFSVNSLRCGICVLQGPHHVAHFSTRTRRPFRSFQDVVFVFSHSVGSSAGAGEPTAAAADTEAAERLTATQAMACRASFMAFLPCVEYFGAWNLAKRAELPSL